MTTVIQTRGLGKQFRRVTALSDCDVTVPEGCICALIGPNGAGKTTLLRLLSGLARPTAGEMSVLGSTPRQDPAFLAGVGFLAQEIPLYRQFTAEEHISIGAHLNRRWDAALVRDRLKSLNIPLDRAAGSLSGGQQAQLALTLTLAKKPRLVLLDEPVAALDPLARRHFLATMADAVADDGLTVVLSSHLVADMERVVDHIILLSASHVQLCGDIDPGHRDRRLRRPRGHPADRDRRRADPPGRLTSARRAIGVPADGAAQPLDTDPDTVRRLGAEGGRFEQAPRRQALSSSV